MSEAFFEAAPALRSTPSKREFRLFYDENGAILEIINVSIDEFENRDYLVITQDQFDAMQSKKENYKVNDNKLELFIPEARYWELQQADLARNPYVC